MRVQSALRQPTKYVHWRRPMDHSSESIRSSLAFGEFEPKRNAPRHGGWILRLDEAPGQPRFG